MYCTIFRNMFPKLFHDGDRYHIETSPLICSANKSMDWFLYDNGLRHERVKVRLSRLKVH